MNIHKDIEEYFSSQKGESGMNLISEYLSEKSDVRCAKVFRLSRGNGVDNDVYQVNFWDANMAIDDWVTYPILDQAEFAAEDFVLSYKAL